MKSGELVAGLAVCLALTTTSAWAGEAGGPSVGRISAVAGSAQYQANESPWSDLLVNEPAGAGTAVRSGPDTSAELQLPGLTIALAGSDDLKILRLDKDTAQIVLHNGHAGFQVDTSAPATVELDLPHGAVWLSAPGVYEIADTDGAPARIEVLAGEALLGGGLSEKNLVTAAADELAAQTPDAKSKPSDEHLPPGIVGAAALAAGGTWTTDATYG
ncbi:MAG: hypothetical protein JO254_12215, partial [Pseudolabrys sp.]|nr:hypothetical protein [Pseudolabrys sp.]